MKRFFSTYMHPYSLLLSTLLLSHCNSSQGTTEFVIPDNETGGTTPNDIGSVQPPKDSSSDGNSDFLDYLFNSGCATARAEANRKPAYVLVVVDGSFSMTKAGKWLALQGTTQTPGVLQTLFTEYQKRNDTSFGLGMLIFSGETTQLKEINEANIPRLWECAGSSPPNAASGSCVNRAIGPDYINSVFNSGLNNKTLYDYLNLYIQQTAPSGDTPIYQALSVAYDKMKAFHPKTPLLSDGDRYVVFITDGYPEGPGGGTDNQILSLAQNAQSNSIRTFVMGVGRSISSNDYKASLLGQLATIGGTAKPNCNPNEMLDASKACFFTINTSANATPTDTELEALRKQFINAFEEIQGGVLSCSYKIKVDPNNPIDPKRTNVIYKDGTGQEHPISPNATDGWSFDNPASPTQVNLNGESCRQLKADPQGKIYIILGCERKPN